MPPRIAIPIPHSDPEYVARSLPQYERAVEMAGGEPVRIPLDKAPSEIMKIIERCDAVLLPGSRADVDPAKYEASRHPSTAEADPKRDTVDELLLQDAYNMRKPVLGICYGLQILNVFRTGTLIQDLAECLPPENQRVNHAAGRNVPVAHAVVVDLGSTLATIVNGAVGQEHGLSPLDREGHVFSRAKSADQEPPAAASEGKAMLIPVNSSHHQAADAVGDGLRVVAHCPDDGVIEALEGTSADHFVLAVQWHPERSVDQDERSRAIFRAVVEAARARHRELVGVRGAVK